MGCLEYIYLGESIEGRNAQAPLRLSQCPLKENGLKQGFEFVGLVPVVLQSVRETQAGSYF